MTSHTDIVVDQFTQQATPFANSTAMRDEEALKLLVEFSGAGADDTVLDVACGPGLVVAAFAKVCRRAAGIDITPAMIEKAREHAAALSLTNVDWHVGNVLPLPFPDRSFSVVVSRFAFHHFVDPLAVLREMARVATRRVVLCDIAASDDPDPCRRAEPDGETTRSLAYARAAARRVALPVRAGRPAGAARDVLRRARASSKRLLATSFPAPGDIAVIRQMFADSLADDGLGMKTRRKDDMILLSYPIAILASDLA